MIASIKLKRNILNLLKYFGIVILFFVILNLIFPLKIDCDYSKVVEDKNGKILKAYLNTTDKWRIYAEDKNISQNLKTIIVKKEDRFFYYHFGVNPLAIIRAIFNNVTQQKRTSGASTITMQVARMFQPKSRTYWHKVVEIFRAFQLEWKYSKKEILQMYLNHVPYGGNIEGIRSASLLFLGKEPNVLSPAEISMLCIVPNKPSTLRLKQGNKKLEQYKNKMLNRILKWGLINKENYELALNEPINLIRKNISNIAPHFCAWINLNTSSQNGIIKSTINFSYQKSIENILKQYVESTQNIGINNGAVLVLENKTGNIVCYAGSNDFYDKKGGQNDGVKAIRSPGSTLKPLLYSYAFEKGLYTPKSIVYDVPRSFDGFEPKNYSEDYKGKTSIEYSLIHSLNIPAVDVLDNMGVPNFIKKLEQLKFQSIHQQKKQLGLSLTLGGCGVSLLELVRSYSVFPNMGELKTTNYIQAKSNNKSEIVTSPAACYMINYILKNLSRPDLPLAYQTRSSIPNIAWKTGTSFGRKDAWSIGYSKKYTIGVWLGNFTNVGVPEMNGIEHATPLLFEIFKSIEKNNSTINTTLPKDLMYRLVCKESGNIPDTFCNNSVEDLYLPGISQNLKCKHKTQVYVSENEDTSYCNHCLPANKYHKIWIDSYPDFYIDYALKNKVTINKPPVHNTHCSVIFKTKGPKITLPINDAEYLIEKEGENKLSLKCKADINTKMVYWYANDQLFKKSKPTETIFISPKSGKLKISCCDEFGRCNEVSVTVSRF